MALKLPPAPSRACREPSLTVFGVGVTLGFSFPLTDLWKLWVRRDLVGHLAQAFGQLLWELVLFDTLHGAPLCMGLLLPASMSFHSLLQ